MTKREDCILDQRQSRRRNASQRFSCSVHRCYLESNVDHIRNLEFLERGLHNRSLNSVGLRQGCAWLTDPLSV